MKIEPVVARTLEIEKVLDLFGGGCRSELGLWSLYNYRPAADIEKLEARQALLREYADYRDRFGDLPWQEGLRLLDDCLENAKESMLLSGEELLLFRKLLSLAGRVRQKISDVREQFSSLGKLGRAFRLFDEELDALGVLADDGRLYDSASPELKDIREKVEGLRRRIRQIGQAILNDPGARSMLQERVLSLRGGRFLVLVKQEHVSLFPGVVSDRSGSGSTVYMEPHSLVPLNNNLTLLLREEKEEERKILRRLTALLLSREKAIREAQEGLGMVDLLYSLASMLGKTGWVLPEVTSKPYFSLKRIRHPLLGDNAVPINVGCGRSFRLLVITGPNTGGKTVALKTCGVGVFLAWCGFPIPAEEGSIVGDFSTILLDIGDEQSIEQNLSTFSGHIRNIIDILERADEKTLVLLDELGAGTDPQEGAALGVAVLDELRERKALVLATTHHNPIKRFAIRAPQVETASVEFNVKTLSPTYRLLTGIPGRSNALLIARRLGMDESVLVRASRELEGNEGSLEELIGELQEKRVAHEQAEESLARERAEVTRLKKQFQEKVDKIESRRDRLLQEADAKAEKILQEAEKRARELLRQLEGAAQSAAQREMGRQKGEIDLIRTQADRRRAKSAERRIPSATTRELKPGDPVEIIDSGVKGVIEEVQGKKARIQAGSMRVDVPIKRLRLRSRDKKEQSQVGVQIKVPRPVGVPSSIMVRGMRIDEALPLVERYLDQAFRAGYHEVTVIHGRGEGILRREVHALCRRLPFIIDFRLGGPSEGGHGVTLVTFTK